MTPEATPREALYIETGLLDVETIIDAKRLNMIARLHRNKSKMMEAILRNPNCKWMRKTKDVMNKYRIEDHGSKQKTKNNMNQKILIQFYKKMTKDKDDRSKLKFFFDGQCEWTPEKPAEYMNKLTRKQASIIFKARTRMLKVKNNYKNAFND